MSSPYPTHGPTKRNQAASGGRSERSTPGNEPLLPRYLREMGATSLIDAEEEVRLARRIEESKIAVYRAVVELPETCREFALASPGEEMPAEGAELSFRQIDHIWRRMRSCETDCHRPACASAREKLRRAKERMEHARESLIVANLRLVVHIARRYVNNDLSLMDLIQEGNLGLLRAVERFDYRRGNRFSTYAYWWIKQSIDRGLIDKGRTIRVPVHQHELRRKIRQAVRELVRDLDRLPSPEEIASRTGLTLDRVREGLTVFPATRSMDDPATREGGQDLADRVADASTSSPFEEARDKELQSRIAHGLSVLEPRERRILSLRFGLASEGPYTLEQVGKIIGLSRERVRQVEGIALQKLRDLDGLADHLLPPVSRSRRDERIH